VDYIERAEKRAHEAHCENIFIRMNTPGGSLQSTRLIIEKILSSDLKYLCLIEPEGAHAGSAGAIILQACHVNGGVTATNIGAATPIMGNGEKTPDDLRKKLINDTVSWLAGVTKLRGRNLKFSEEIITEAKSLSSEEAQKKGALDVFATDETDFLKKSKIPAGTLQEFTPDLRYKILSFISDPEFVYMLFMGSLALLYVEITHPGLIAPGVIGGMGLILSLVAFHKLNVFWGGIVLILLGLSFLVAEIFLPTFGTLGIGGLVAVFVGSVFLFDPSSGLSLPMSLIGSVVFVLAVVCLSLGFFAIRTLRLKKKDLDHDLHQHDGVVVTTEASGHRGQIRIMGETWIYVSEDSLNINDKVEVTGRQGLTLNVKKKRGV
jgi:membrane-bound serine protease (ClpP class)